MECIECHGVGLVDKVENGIVFGQDVCPVCKGLGHDGTRVEAAKEVKITKKKK